MPINCHDMRGCSTCRISALFPPLRQCRSEHFQSPPSLPPTDSNHPPTYTRHTPSRAFYWRSSRYPSPPGQVAGLYIASGLASQSAIVVHSLSLCAQRPLLRLTTSTTPTRHTLPLVRRPVKPPSAAVAPPPTLTVCQCGTPAWPWRRRWWDAADAPRATYAPCQQVWPL